MNPDARRQLSKRLSYHLRHGPGDAGLKLDRGGWVAVPALLEGLDESGRSVSREEIEEVVASGGRQRFELSADGGHIRARYGHSIPVDLDHAPAEPPEQLYHGTTPDALASIRRTGLVPGSRQQVHLSTDRASARRVGARHGRPVVLVVDAPALVADGHRLTRASDEVWLIDHVPPRYLSGLDAGSG